MEISVRGHFVLGTAQPPLSRITDRKTRVRSSFPAFPNKLLRAGAAGSPVPGTRVHPAWAQSAVGPALSEPASTACKARENGTDCASAQELVATGTKSSIFSTVGNLIVHRWYENIIF